MWYQVDHASVSSLEKQRAWQVRDFWTQTGLLYLLGRCVNLGKLLNLYVPEFLSL